MNVVYCGSGEFGIDCLEAITASDHRIAAVFTQPAQPAGRKRALKPTAVAQWAHQHRIDCIEAADINTPEMIEKTKILTPDLLVVIAFGQKISSELIDLPPKGAINVHASLLPKYRGAAPVNWAIIGGEKKTGISIIRLAQRMDAGDILAAASTPIGENETAGQLHDRLAKLAAPVLVETLDKIENDTITPIQQQDQEATKAPKLKKSDGNIDFARPAAEIKQKILGFWPWPGARAVFQPKGGGTSVIVTFAGAEVVDAANPHNDPPGTLDENLNVICAKQALHMKQLKPAGSKLMSFEDFVNGRHVRPGDRFEKIQ